MKSDVMDFLERLRGQLEQVNSKKPVSIPASAVSGRTCPKPDRSCRAHECRCRTIDEVLAELEERARSSGSNYEPRDLQVEAVKRFWDTQQFESLRQARLVCFGLAIHPWNDHRCLMEEPERFDAALAGLREWEQNPRQFSKCYRGLIHSYFDYDGLGRDVPATGQRNGDRLRTREADEEAKARAATGQRNWRRLRTYLGDKVTLIRTDDAVNPDWVVCAQENKELFSETPCAAYAQDLLDGREDKVKHIRELLGTTDASWFTRELVLSQIARVCGFDHATFTMMVGRLLALLGSNEVLRDCGLQMMLDRYARVPEAPQHPGLKDYSVRAWGNPWLPSDKYRWGGVTDQARRMVEDWLKLEYIELFFHKLAKDHLGDSRRVKFWQRYVSTIEDIRFALGKHAEFSSDRDFVELRKKLDGLTVPLEDGNPHNNAFIMTVGDMVAVEFSGESNAFYGYSRKRELPFDLNKPVRSRPVNGPNSLKNDACTLYLRHQDNVHGYTYWEDRFKSEFQEEFGLIPGRTDSR